MLRPLLLFLFVFTLISCKQQTSKSSDAINDSLTKKLDSIYQQHHFAGFSVAIVNDSGIAYENGFGFADMATQKKYTSTTIQNIASVSKTLLGVSLLKAQELGKLNLDDSVNQYLPFRVVNPAFPGASITIRQLASHTSSIRDNEIYLTKSYVVKNNADIGKLMTRLDEEQQLLSTDSAISMAIFLQQYLDRKGKWYQGNAFTEQHPGDLYEYSNVGTALAAYVLEKATGMKYEAFTSTYILQPLGMKSSGWHFNDVDFNNYSTLYYNRDTVIAHYSLVTFPDGNFITSAHDLALFLQELIRGYSGHGSILNSNSYKVLFTPSLTSKQNPDPNTNNPYSDGFNYSVFMGFSFSGNIGHTGGDPGVTSLMFFDPATKTGRLLLLNTNVTTQAAGKAFYGIMDAMK